MKETQGKTTFLFFNGLRRGLLHFVLIAGGVMMIVPFLWMISTSLKSPKEVLSFPPTWIPKGHFVRGQVLDRPEKWVEVDLLSQPDSEGCMLVQERFPGDTSPDGRKRLLLPLSDIRDRFRFELRNYRIAWQSADFLRYFLNTVFISLSVLIGVLLTSCLAAYAFARFEFRGREGIFILFLSMMMIPQPVYLVPSFLILARFRWIDTYMALIVPWVASVFSIFLLRQHFKTIPKDLYDAATIDGCNRFWFLWRIVVPLSKATLITVSLFSIIGSWNSFMWPLVMVNKDKLRPLQIGLARFAQEQGSEHNLMMAAATFCIVPLLLIYFFAQRQIMSSFAQSGMKE